MPTHYSTVAIGGGPAGLTAAYELSKHGVDSIVFEQADKVGGIARTEVYKGYRFDIGGHRFFTKVLEVQRLWHEILGEEFCRVPRLSRIYYRGRFFNYPLEPVDALMNLGFTHSIQILASYLQAKIHPIPDEQNFEQWVTNRFGQQLYETFFKTYTEKVWGIPCHQIQADWAAQRIQGMSLKRAILNAVLPVRDAKSMIKEFDYPRLGPGMMWESLQARLEQNGVPVHLNSRVVRIEHSGRRVQNILVQHQGQTVTFSAEHFISSMPISAAIARLDPPPPAEVLDAAKRLNYRDFLIVSLIVNREHLFPDNWIYIHSPEFNVGRIQNFKNWSADMVPDASKTCLGMEYFCSQGDSLWSMSDTELIDLAGREVVDLGLIERLSNVEDGVVIRQRKAYPVYDGEYQQNLAVIRSYLDAFENLQVVGRNGMHRYNNQDHSMLTGLLAARNVLGEQHDLWAVNTERSYYEEFTKVSPHPRPQTRNIAA
jgi:protoporphyrinogen oxidase